jgi:hypothetical protein
MYIPRSKMRTILLIKNSIVFAITRKEKKSKQKYAKIIPTLMSCSSNFWLQLCLSKENGDNIGSINKYSATLPIPKT